MIDQKTLHHFQEIYDETYTQILTYVICHCSNIEDVKDIMQNIYFDALKYIKKNKHIEYPLTFMKRIATNKVNDYYRYKTKRTYLPLEVDDQTIDIPSDIDIEKIVIQKQDIDEIWNYLKRKNIIIAKIFYLYYYLGMTLKEISIELDMSESQIKHSLYRTLKELNLYLERMN